MSIQCVKIGEKKFGQVSNQNQSKSAAKRYDKNLHHHAYDKNCKIQIMEKMKRPNACHIGQHVPIGQTSAKIAKWCIAWKVPNVHDGGGGVLYGDCSSGDGGFGGGSSGLGGGGCNGLGGVGRGLRGKITPRDPKPSKPS